MNNKTFSFSDFERDKHSNKKSIDNNYLNSTTSKDHSKIKKKQINRNKVVCSLAINPILFEKMSNYIKETGWTRTNLIEVALTEYLKNK